MRNTNVLTMPRYFYTKSTSGVKTPVKIILPNGTTYTGSPLSLTPLDTFVDSDIAIYENGILMGICILNEVLPGGIMFTPYQEDIDAKPRRIAMA